MLKFQYTRNLIEANFGPFVTISSEGKITAVAEASLNSWYLKTTKTCKT